ncbi:tetratricopeptide repeat protein [Nocardia arizonensis]|uniref:tetratricopeptide repeat protein n=1 Tax=Nocardia arizonensis TaxID=1141647 RepID=UPI0006D0938E|nr:tetratricopeptide repeat protein [Nocardia arizonensis]
MAGRLALVVGAECAALGELGFVSELAGELDASLTAAGGWRPALSATGPLLDPTAAQLFSAVDEAFQAADAQQATLLLAFIGHGVAVGESDYYLLGHDSPPTPTLHTAFHLIQEIRERLDRWTLDGLVVLVDACEPEQGVLGAARRWTDVLARSSGRMELLVASGDGPAFAGCFTRTLLTTFEAGLPSRGENLLPSDLVGPIATACTRQQPQHLSFTSGAVSEHGGDPGLWLVPNVALRGDADAGRAAAGFVDQLTRRLLLTESVREALTGIMAAGEHRLRAVVGPPGVGKSTLLATLVRPSLLDTMPFAPEYVTAVVFLTVHSSFAAVSGELAAQLSARLPGFAEAVAATRHAARVSATELDGFDIEVCRPLARLAANGRRITLVLDGLNQPEEGVRSLLCRAVAQLTTRPALRNVYVIIGFRAGAGVENDPALAHMHRIEVAEPAVDEIVAVLGAFGAATDERLPAARWIDDLVVETSVQADGAVAGGWLLARLLVEVVTDIGASGIADGLGLDGVVALRVEEAVRAAGADGAAGLGPLLAVLVAAGVGPVLPLELLDAAMSALGAELGPTRIRDLTVGLGVLVTRSKPGTEQETLGITHSALVRALRSEIARMGVDLVDAHWAISRAIEVTESPRVHAYARGSGARHYLAHGDSGAALAFLTGLETPRAADNRDLWAAWLPSFVAGAGAEDPDTMQARGNLARWRGRSGDLGGAIAETEALLADANRLLGPLDAITLATRNNLAWLRGEGGDLRAAMAEFERLLADQRRMLPPDHPDIFRTRNNLAYFRAHSGDLAGAIGEFERLHTDHLAAMGSDHPDTFGIRNNLATFRAESGDLPGAIADYELLLADLIRVLGPDDPVSLDTRDCLAWCRARSGDLRGAVREFQQLLSDQVRVLGPDHPDTLMTRDHLAYSRGKAGDTRGAIAELDGLLADRLRVLGADHPETLGTRGSLAVFRAESGDHATAIDEFERLLADQLRAIGPDHPSTLVIRGNLAGVRSGSGDFVRARTEYERLLRDRLRILGPDHPDTLATRNNLAYCRAHSGDLRGATAEFERLLADQLRVLGPDHPNTLSTRNNVALYRGESGDLAEAIRELEYLVVDMLRVLGPVHPSVLEARHNLLAFGLRNRDLSDITDRLSHLIAEKQQVLGKDHPGVLITRSLLLDHLTRKGESALADYELLLADRLRILGPDHPATLDTRYQLARIRGRTGDATGAAREYEILLAAWLRLFGPDHPVTLTTRNELARRRAESGDLEGALTEFETLCAGLALVLGPMHRTTLRARNNLAHVRAASGAVAAAVTEWEAVLADQIRAFGTDDPDAEFTREILAHWREAR